MRSKDNRRDPRKRHNSVLEIFDGTGKLIAGSGRLVDWSPSGARFSSAMDLACGALVRARLRLLDKGALDVSARVVWRRKGPGMNQYGVQFDSVKSVHPAEGPEKPGPCG